MNVRQAEADHGYEHRCCWNCAADNARIPSEQPPFDPQGFRGLFEAVVICHEDRCPHAQKYGDYGSPPIKEHEWHSVAMECPAWVSASGDWPEAVPGVVTRGGKT